VVPTNRYVVFLTIALGGCAVDLATKAWIFAWPPGPGRRGEWWLFENYVGIQQALNQGALFGLGQGFSLGFAALSVAALLGIAIWLFVYQAAQDRLLTIALGSVCGGILGNLYDRLGLPGLLDKDGQTVRAVRDWILFCYHDYIWPNFNIADCLLVCGAGLLAFHSLRPLSQEHLASAQADNNSSAAPPQAA